MKFLIPDHSTSLPLPFFSEGVAAGFPSPADGYVEKQLDLNDLLIQHPSATFFVKVEGESMQEAHIRSGDILVVDRSLEPLDGKIIIAALQGEFTVKRLKINSQGVYLIPANPAYETITISPELDFQIWGVVTYVIHKL